MYNLSDLQGINLNSIDPRFTLSAKKNEEVDGEKDLIHSFGEILKSHVSETNKLQTEASSVAQSFVTGGNVDLHTVMIAAEKAEIAMKLTLQLRNKLVDAYREITNMQI